VIRGGIDSVRQVQDLERQLLEARQQLERFRALEHKSSFSIDPRPDTPSSQAFAEFPAVGRSPRRMLKARSPQDLSYARVQLSDVGRGLLKPPVTAAHARNYPVAHSGEAPALPSRMVADPLLHYYYECIHRHFPVLHWPTFEQNYGIAMERGPNSMASDWLAAFFAVLACGALSTHEPSRLQESQEYLTRSMTTISFWEDDVSTNQAIVAFLASLALAEMNRKSASWIWLGSAIRIAQDLGLHVQGGQWSSVEGEMRKRIWYSFYAWDRSVWSFGRWPVN